MEKYNFKQERSDYLTPPEILEEIFQELNLLGIYTGEKFDCDVCCSQKNIPAHHHFINGEQDGLKESWHKGWNYCNPEYKVCEKWVKKAYQEFQNGKSSVLLIPARTETKYWQEYILDCGYATKPNVYVRFLRKGYSFINPEDNSRMGVFKNALAIVIFDASKTREKAVA